MGEGSGGEHDAVEGRLKAGGSRAMVEDANSQRVLQQGPVRAAAAAAGITVAAGDDDQIESSLISEFGAQNQDEMEEGSANHLFTDAMKLQLRAQILVLGDLL